MWKPETMPARDLEFMAEACALAQEAVAQRWGGPFGAVVVLDGQVIGRGQNRVLLTGDPTAHAEISAIRKASEVLNPWAPAIGGQHQDQSTLALMDRPVGDADPAPARARMLYGAVLYTSAFPCPMCLGAIYWARISTVFYGCSADDAAAIGFDDAFIYEDFANPVQQRRVNLQQIGRDLGLGAFRAWESLAHRHPY
jgi:tRNA(Arg) A34 adenosine deaminase TadA